MIFSIIKRFFTSLLTLFSVLVLTFVLLHTIPGGPFDQERELPPEIRKNLHAKYGLSERGNQNFWTWFGGDLASYIGYLKKGELGPSLKYRDRDVGDVMTTALKPSLELGFDALFISLVLGVLLGIFSAKSKDGLGDTISLFLSSLFVSFPRFIAACGFVFIFSYLLKLLPPALWEGGSFRILPVITLSLAPWAYFFQLTRTGLLNELKQDYLRTARAKGVGFFPLLMKHALKNAALPLLTVIGPMTAQMITGSFIVETVFAIPGLGRHFVNAVTDRDYFLVMGITLFYSALLITLNWLTDVGYLVLDPRMRKTGEPHE